MIEFTSAISVEGATGDVLAVPVFAGLTWGPGAEWAANRLGDWVPTYLESRDFSGKAGQLVTLPGAGALGFESVLFVGLGDEADVEGLRRAAASVGQATRTRPSVATTLAAVDLDEAVEASVFGFALGQYSFDRYRSEPTPASTERVVLVVDGDVGDQIRHGSAVAAAVTLARDLINEPAGDQPPAVLAERAAQLAAERAIAVTVYDEAQIVEEGFGGLAAVGAGASNPPRMVVLDYSPEGAEKTLALVGKGIVFDSGGLSIKPAAGMETMKTDMSGAAAVLAAVLATSDMGLPIRVIGIMPLSENMPGGSAQRPGDVMRARNGKTIEVLNTDAEGRLVLADGLSLAVESKPDLVVDVATLTGACNIALGPKIAGLWSNDDDAASRVAAAASRSGEKVWRMPLEGEYTSHIESSIADMKNTGERYGSAIAAALILAEFVGDTPWVHLDIAGPARSAKAEHYLSKGGTGFGVRTLIALAEDLVREIAPPS
jgi:leucyl aminopeptidase